MVDVAALKAMAAAGATVEVIIAAVERQQQQDADRRARHAQAQARHKALKDQRRSVSISGDQFRSAAPENTSPSGGAHPAAATSLKPSASQRANQQNRDSSSLFPSSLSDDQQSKEGVGGRARGKKRSIPLPENFITADQHYALAVELGRPRGFADECCEEMRCWALGKGELRVDWVAVLSGWMRREARKTGPPRNGYSHAPPRPGSKEDLRERNDRAFGAIDPIPDAHGHRPSQGARSEIEGLLPLGDPG